jgi:ribose transport system permease protein
VSQESHGDRAPRGSRSFVAIVFSRYGGLVLLLLMVIAFSLKSEQFLTIRNFQNVLVVQSVVTCMAFAAVVPLIVGEFDLSLGYLIGFLAMIGAYLGGAGYGAEFVVPAMLVAGVLVGIVNGLLTVRLHISSFIATLGTGILLSGMTLGISGGQVLFSGIPKLITRIGQGSIFGLGPAVWLTIVLAVILFFVLEHTPLGRKLYAIGGSERVAFLAGVPVGALKIASFAISGFLVGIGAIFALGQCGVVPQRDLLPAGLLQRARHRHRDPASGGRLQRPEPARCAILGAADLQRRRSSRRRRHGPRRRPSHQEIAAPTPSSPSPA